MKLGVFGSRTIFDDRAKMEMQEVINALQGVDTIVTTQEPRGVCEVAQHFAKERNLILELHFLDTKRYARGAFEHRSDAVIKASDHILLIHDGASRGTANELVRVKKFKKPYTYVKLEPSTELERSAGANMLKQAPPELDFLDALNL